MGHIIALMATSIRVSNIRTPAVNFTRRACGQDQPDCRPGIRVQLGAERRRSRIGMGALAKGQVVRQRTGMRRSKKKYDDGDGEFVEDDDGLSTHITLERPPSFGKHKR